MYDEKVQELLDNLNLSEFIALDLETTGLNPVIDKITEVSACRFVNGKFVNEFTTLIDPEIPIPSNITSITGITSKMVNGAPLIGGILSDLLEFIGNCPLVGHNIDFDYNFINYNLNDEQKSIFSPDLYDTLPLSRSFLHYVNNFSLGSLCDYYNIKIENAHRAKSDAFSTGILFIYLIKEVASKPLSLIQRINQISSSSEINNHKLYADLINISVQLNKIDGIVNINTKYKASNNYYRYESNSSSEMPDSPLKWFEDQGAIHSSFKNYEVRTSQKELISESFKSFINQEILIAEAGTGLGKSLAYISSGFLSSKNNSLPLVISTHTKNLQDQLFNIDIPKFSKCINQDIDVVIYKGRHNYICKSRLDRIISNYKNYLNLDEYENLITLIVWEWETKTGDISECHGFQQNLKKRMWSLLRSESGFCSPKECIKYQGCYLGKVKSKVEISDLIIINHSLFANELKRESSCLPNDFIYVIDEAHHFANAIRDQLETQMGTKTFDEVFNFFINSANIKKKEIINSTNILKIFNDLKLKSKIIKIEFEDFFKTYYQNKSHLFQYSDYHVNKLLYNNPEEEFVDTQPSPWELKIALLEYKEILDKLINLLNDKKDSVPRSFFSEINVIYGLFNSGLDSFELSIDNNTNHVKWTTFIKSDYQNIIRLNTSPVSVKEFINNNLLSKYYAGLFCSATLMVNDDFRYFKEKVGLDLVYINKTVKEYNFYSPFHYSDQAKLFIFNKKLDVNDSKYLKEVATQLIELNQRLKKRTLVLCTSFKQINVLKNYIESRTSEKEINVYSQGPGKSKNVLVSSYLNNSNSMLIGTSSFWEGVDFPGDKVEILYIVKTPFENPYEPLVQSQIEILKKSGQDAFMDYQIPEAILRFRQGFGRLIRNMSDSGICIISDTRLYSRRYGEIILNSFPLEPTPYQNIDSLLSQSQKFFLT